MARAAPSPIWHKLPTSLFITGIKALCLICGMEHSGWHFLISFFLFFLFRMKDKELLHKCNNEPTKPREVAQPTLAMKKIKSGAQQANNGDDRWALTFWGRSEGSSYHEMKVLTSEGLPTVVEVKDQAICYARHFSRESCAVGLRTQVGPPLWLGHTKCSVPATIVC